MDWRTRWAERENAQRRNAYESAMSRWQRVDGELRAMVEAARSFDGMPTHEAPTWLDLRRGERLLWLGPAVQLMETPAWSQLGPPGYASLSVDHLVGPFNHVVPAPLTAVDRGPVAVTDKRVVVAGRRRREWVYAKLAGLGHLPNTSCTLMFVTNRAKVSGVLLDPAGTAPFRFNLVLGLADAIGERAGFVAHLERHVAWHRSIQPLPVAEVNPADAPAPVQVALNLLKTAVIGPARASAGRRIAHLGGTFMVLLVLLALLTPGGGDPQNVAFTPGPSPAARETAAATAPEPTPTTASPTPTQTPTPTPTVVKETVTETRPVSFKTRTVRDSSMDKGDREVRTTGVAGERTITYEVTYVDGKQTAKKQLSSEVTKPPVTQVVAVGTREEPEPEPEPEPDCHPNYSGACVPIASDVDCEDGSGNGPAYVDGPVYIEGEDVYDLDRDGDGVACEK